MANTFTIKVAWNGHTLRDGETVSIQMVPGGSVVDADLTASFSDQVAAAVAGLDGVTWDDGTNTLTIGYGAPNPVPIPITVEADASDELDETFAVTITNQSAGRIGSQSATVVFRDTSGSVPPSVPTDALFTPETGFESGVPEDTATNTRVGTLSATSTLPVTWVGTGTTAFRVSGDGVFTDAELNYEIASAHTITCTPSNSEGAGTPLPVEITIVNVNEAPTDIAMSAQTVAENAAASTAVGTCTVTDPDASDTVAWSLTDSSGGVFQINSSTGAVTTTGVPFSYSAGNRSITVKATDSGGLTFEKTFTITVTKTNQTPTSVTFTPAGGSITVGTAIGTVVGTLSTVDPDPADTFTYSLLLNPSSRYAISGDKVVTAAALVAGTDTLQFRSTDAGGLTVDSTTYDITVVTPAGSATAWPAAGPKDWMFAAFVQPPSNFAAWKSRGCTGMIAVPQDQDYDEWDQAMIAQGLYAIREQHPTAPTADDSVESNKAILIKDEPDNVTNGGNLDYPNVTWTPTQMQAFKTQMLSDVSPTVFPAFSNLVGNHIWPDFGQTSAVMEDYVKGTEIDWLSFDTYQLADGRSNTVTQSTNGVTYHSTYQGHTLDIINGWLDEATETKPVFTFLQTADFANNGLVPTPAQFRVQFWSSIIHGAAGIFYFPILFDPAFSFDGTPANLIAEMKAQHAVAQTYKDILIDTTNGGRTAYTLRKSAASGASPTGTQLPYPFEGCSVVDGTDTYFFVLNLDDTASHSLTDATWSLSNVSFGPGEMKAGLVIETPAETTNFRSSIPVLEPALPYGRPATGRPDPKDPSTQAIPGMVVATGQGTSAKFVTFTAPGQYWDYDFRGYYCVVASSGVDIRYCLFNQPAAWSGVAAIIMDWNQQSTVVDWQTAPVYTGFVFKYNTMDGGFTSATSVNITTGILMHRTEVDISRNLFTNLVAQGIIVGGGRVDQNVLLNNGWDPGNHVEQFAVLHTFTSSTTALEITRNYSSHWTPTSGGLGGPTGNVKCWNEGGGVMRGEVVFDDNYMFSTHPSNTNPIAGGQNPFYVIQPGAANARRWFSGKVSGYLKDNDAGANYQYSSTGFSVLTNMSFQGVTDPVKSHTFSDVNVPTKPSASSVTLTAGTSGGAPLQGTPDGAPGTHNQPWPEVTASNTGPRVSSFRPYTDITTNTSAPWYRIGNLIFTGQADAVLEGYDLRGCEVYPKHPRWIVRDCKFNCATGSTHVVWVRDTDQAYDGILTYNECDGGRLNNTNNSFFGVWTNIPTQEVSYNRVTNMPSDVFTSAGPIRLGIFNYVRGIGYQTGSHPDVFTFSGGYSGQPESFIAFNVMDEYGDGDAVGGNSTVKIDDGTAARNGYTVYRNVHKGGTYQHQINWTLATGVEMFENYRYLDHGSPVYADSAATGFEWRMGPYGTFVPLPNNQAFIHDEFEARDGTAAVDADGPLSYTIAGRPAQVTINSIDEDGNFSINAVSGATSYQYRVSIANTGRFTSWQTLTTTGSGPLTGTLTLIDDAYNHVHIRAVNANGPGPSSTTYEVAQSPVGSIAITFSLPTNATALEIRYAASTDEQWSRLTEITSGYEITGLPDGEYIVQHRGINRGSGSISRGDWVESTVTVGTVTPSAPAFTGSGAVLTQTTGTSGSPVVGDSFSVSYTASGFPSPTPTYQWKWEDGTSISGATSSTYTSVGTDEGHQLKCSVHLSNASGTADDDTALSGTIAASGGGGGGGIAIDTVNIGAQNGVYVHFGWSPGDFTIPIPAARAAGTLMIAVLDFGEYSDAGTPTLSAGWTKSTFFKTFRGGLAIAWKVSDGTETSLSVNIDETQYGTDQCTLFGKVFLITGQTITPSGISGYGDWGVTDSFCTGVSTTIPSGVTDAIAFQIVQFDNANTTTGTVAGWTKLYETNGVNDGGGPGTNDYERRSGHAVYYKTGQSTGTVSGTQVNLNHALAVYRNGLGFYVY
jgi:hypothetical protein